MKAFPRDIEVVELDQRHIGVETEIDDRGTDDNLLRAHGILDSVDGDSRGPREYRTVPISVRSLKQVRGHRYLSEYFEEIRRKTVVASWGGTHIHISILNSDHENMESNAIALSIAFFKQFQKISGRETRWAKRMGYSTLERVRVYLNGQRRKEGGRRYYRDFYMLTATGRQTLEFRGPVGSGDGQEILAWIEFINNVVNVANRESIEGVTFRRLLRGKRISEYVKSFKGRRALTEKDLNMRFNGDKL